MAYVPDRGDWVWLDFDPQAGREQSGDRPALVLSPAEYNRRARLCLVCPVTGTKRGLRTQVPIPAGQPVSGVVLADHIKSIDYKARGLRYAGAAPPEVIDATVSVALSLIDPV